MNERRARGLAMARLERLTAKQVDVVLEVLVATAIASGIASLAFGTSWARAITAVHGIAGLSLVVLVPAKVRGSVRTGLRRGRASRWVSVGFGVLVLATIALGFLHSTGLWFGVGQWTALWTHEAFAFGVLALFTWHLFSRPVRPKLADVGRRAVLRAGGGVVVGAAAYGSQEVLARIAGLAGGTRRFSGSHDIASFEPAAMPSVSWINDRAPASTDAEGWSLVVDRQPVELARLRRLAKPVVATVDCTGGWSSTQSWDAVPLSAVLDLARQDARSIKITSATGYHRLFPVADLDRVFLAIGYHGQVLRPHHGAPVRVVAPGRRGPWWVKWVTTVELDDRPWWLQLPFPLD